MLLFFLRTAGAGEPAMSLVDAATVVLDTPTVLTGPHPSALYAVYLFKVLSPKTRFVSVVCSFGWGGNMLKSTTDMLPHGNVEVLGQVIINGYPGKSDLRLLENLSESIVERHRKLNLLRRFKTDKIIIPDHKDSDKW